MKKAIFAMAAFGLLFTSAAMACGMDKDHDEKDGAKTEEKAT